MEPGEEAGSAGELGRLIGKLRVSRLEWRAAPFGRGELLEAWSGTCWSRVGGEPMVGLPFPG